MCGVVGEFVDCSNSPVRCRVSGDPHFTTWDGGRHHYQGGGADGAYYDYVTECLDGNGDPENNLAFNIAAFQQICNGPYTCVFGVKVELDDGTVINFPRNGIRMLFENYIYFVYFLVYVWCGQTRICFETLHGEHLILYFIWIVFE